MATVVVIFRSNLDSRCFSHIKQCFITGKDGKSCFIYLMTLYAESLSDWSAHCGIDGFSEKLKLRNIELGQHWDGWPWPRFVAQWGILRQRKNCYKMTPGVRYSGIVNWQIYYLFTAMNEKTNWAQWTALICNSKTATSNWIDECEAWSSPVCTLWTAKNSQINLERIIHEWRIEDDENSLKKVQGWKLYGEKRFSWSYTLVESETRL